MAQGSSQRTQVSLARFKEADERLFRSMPWVPPTLKVTAKKNKYFYTNLQMFEFRWPQWSKKFIIIHS